ncbi:hypothetical protein ABZV78_24775 [Micromonospora sp. NPDC004540]|uniref:hypothetical protein n=1 Tax=Micromonospora sp. NPDC004540 TaxID=3154457 RepID=UPI0033AD0668
MRVASAVDGAIAGAVGSAALNVVSFLDMAVRGRPASSTPEQTAGRFADAAHVDLGPEEKAANRRSGIGPVIGYGTGVAAGALFGLLAARRRVPLPLAVGLLGGGVMASSDGSIAALGISDPRTWRKVDWLSDLVPHLAYGAAAAATWRRLRPPSRRG